MFSPKTSRIQPSMFTGLVPSESGSVLIAADAGISHSTVLSARLPCQLMVLCICGRATAKIYTASEVLRGTVTTSTKARCAWDSGLVTVLSVLRLMPTQAGSQCPGSLLKKFLNPRLRFSVKTSILVELYQTSSFCDYWVFCNCLNFFKQPNKR